MAERRNEADGRSHRRAGTLAARPATGATAAMKPMAEATGELEGVGGDTGSDDSAAMKPMAEATGETAWFVRSGVQRSASRNEADGRSHRRAVSAFFVRRHAVGRNEADGRSHRRAFCPSVFTHPTRGRNEADGRSHRRVVICISVGRDMVLAAMKPMAEATGERSTSAESLRPL